MTNYIVFVVVVCFRIGVFISVAGLSAVAVATELDVNADHETQLEHILVTAQRRVQNAQDVPVSIATLSGEKLDALFSSGDDIQALTTKIPGLYIESSNGRIAPRFYIRGLGNTDFDLAASQPVSVIMDEVVMENVVLKSFPLFDTEQIEVLRGPQGSLFGRNTTAGIVKITSVKPEQDFSAYTRMAAGSLGTLNLEAAAGGGLTESLSGRISLLSQQRSDYIDNAFTEEPDFTGGHKEKAGRLQLRYESTDFQTLLNIHNRDLDGSSSVFRANVLTKGSNQLNENYQRDRVWHDSGDGNFRLYKGFGASLAFEFMLPDMSLTIISALEKADGRGKSDVDGGYRIDANFDGVPEQMGPGFIPFSAVTEDQLNNLQQITQEIRLASDTDKAVQWQMGAFYFDSSFGVTSIDGFFGATSVYHSNQSWALFGQTSYELTEEWTLSGGIRYTFDEKFFWVGEQNVGGAALAVGAARIQQYDPIFQDDGQWSWDFSSNYQFTNKVSGFARLAKGFRAPSIQGRNVAFERDPTTAESETIHSAEVGIKSDLLDDSLRLNAALFYYLIDDMQLSAIGGASNSNTLLNADKGTGYGFEVDLTWHATKSLVIAGGFSYNHTNLKDDDLLVGTCAACTLTSPYVNLPGAGSQRFAYVDGHSFPQAPETILTLNARYGIPLRSGELYFYGDIAVQGKTNLFLYQSEEFNSSGNYEAGLRIGYLNFAGHYEAALFGRNITDEHNLKGAIDFNNLAGFVNEPRVIGVEFKKSFF